MVAIFVRPQYVDKNFPFRDQTVLWPYHVNNAISSVDQMDGFVVNYGISNTVMLEIP